VTLVGPGGIGKTRLAQLGDAAFDAAFSEGQAMTTDQSIDLALRGKAPRRKHAGRRASLSEP